MSATEEFLTKAEELEVVEAIRKAEKETSGEIRVHIEKTSGTPPFERATEVFNTLGMANTKLKNGVLIYLALDDKAFAIIGDKGINEVVGSDFWDDTRDAMQRHFKSGDFKRGLVAGITRGGEKLQRYFPCEDDDADELSNEISRG